MRYHFEGYVLDTERRELRSDTDLVPLEPQVFDLLIYLIRNRERVVSKDDLLASVWRGRVVSDTALTSRINSARSALGDSGQKQRLIKTLPRKGVRFVGAVREEHQQATREVPRALSLPDRPSIAVLPFTNMSGDPEQDYFADGMVEEIITALSHLRWLFVIARNSTFTYKGRAVDVKQVGRELGVRYVLEGSVRKAADRVRITAQLVDASTGAHLWADRFEGTLKDIFDLQDQVTASVVGSIAPQLERAEIERATRKPTENLDAYDYFLKGMANVHLWTKDANREALQLFYRAIELDPNFAAAYGLAARCYSQRKVSGWTIDREQERLETERLARRAAQLGPDVPLALCTAGLGLAHVAGEIDDAAALIARSLELNPNLAWAWLFNGWVKVLAGKPEEAIESVSRAMRLSPQDPHIFNMQGVIAWAYFCAERFDEASVWAEKAVQYHPHYLLGSVIHPASKALAGQLSEAQRAMARLRQLDPKLRISNLKELAPLRRPVDLMRWADGLRKAGLPE
jgi:TolB-like protein/Tfp pilus assembly protein PilF